MAAGAGYDISSSQTLSNASRGGKYDGGTINIGSGSVGGAASNTLLYVVAGAAVLIVAILFLRKR